MLSFLLNRSENFLTEFVVLWEPALSLGVTSPVCKGEEPFTEAIVFPVPGVAMLKGRGESSD